MENLRNEIEVIESVCFPCHSNCGASVHVQDGRVSKVKSDDDQSENTGMICPRGLAFT